MLSFLALTSPNGTRDDLYLANYANSNVKNTLLRIPGMGRVEVMGASYSMRIWLAPERLSSLGLSARDIASAIQQQNRQVALGSIGSVPTDNNSHVSIMYSVITKGRLSDTSEFEDIIIKDSDGVIVKLKDVARIEIGADSYSMTSYYMGNYSALISLTQGADANAIDVMRDVKKA